MDFGLWFHGLFALGTLVILGIFLVILVQGVRTWNKNNHSPRLSVEARVTGKRADVSQHNHPDSAGTSATWYYVTFQVDSGDRMELSVSGWEYGLMAEGDTGTLTFQGTRFLGFQRRGAGTV